MHNESQVTYSIVVPFYNEQESIPLLYVKICEVMDAVGALYEIVFVDDGSLDATYVTLLDLYENDRHVHVIRLRRNFGQTAALKAGFDFARGDIVVSMDGDLQHDPGEIPLFLEKMKEGYDIVSGWRVDRQDAWLTRRLPSRVANWIMAQLSGVDLHDFGTTFKAYRREMLDEVHLYGELHRFIPALASWIGARTTEVPISNRLRPTGKSNYGLGRATRVLLDLLSIKFLLGYSTRPLQFFGLFGLLSASIGVLINLLLFFDKIVYGQSIMAEHGPLLMLGIALVVAGIQFLSFGLLGEMLARIYYESQNKPIYAVRELKSRRQGVRRTHLSGTIEPGQLPGV
ncbi:MAG TPA: glycosyltransferase family 2 protein [Candidatus Dormibacteraeota bacterium]|nr:glycosyltransferase family 2 protein [Candidatus Dormibacteraeota bacterium]